MTWQLQKTLLAARGPDTIVVEGQEVDSWLGETLLPPLLLGGGGRSNNYKRVEVDEESPSDPVSSDQLNSFKKFLPAYNQSDFGGRRSTGGGGGNTDQLEVWPIRSWEKVSKGQLSQQLQKGR